MFIILFEWTNDRRPEIALSGYQITENKHYEKLNKKYRTDEILKFSNRQFVIFIIVFIRMIFEHLPNCTCYYVGNVTRANGKNHVLSFNIHSI